MSFDLSPLWISLQTSAVATGITFFLGIAAAAWMNQYDGKAKIWLDGILTLPLVLPPTVVGFLLLLLLGKNSPVGQLLSALGITVIFSWAATVIAATIVAFPLMYRVSLGAFQQVKPTLIQAAQTLGVSPFGVFWQVTLPLALPGVIAATILAFARALGEFGATLMLAGNIPGKTQTIPIAIFFEAEAGNFEQSLAWVIIIIALALATIAALNYWSRVGQTARIQSPLFRGAATRKAFARSTADPSELPLAAANALPIQPVEFSQRWATPELEVDLQKAFPRFSLQVNFSTNGQPLGLLGASGSGKSLLLRCIAGLDSPDRGRITLNQTTLFDAKLGINVPSHQRRIGLVFQDYALFPHMTVAQNIGFGLQKLSQQERSQQVAQQLAALHLQHLQHCYPDQLSGGQQQRVALARALVTKPDSLLLDEPFSALDTHLRSQMERQLIEVLSTYQGVTLLVTHNLEEAYRICDDLLVLVNGRCQAHGSKQAIFEHPNTLTVAQLTGCKNFSRLQVETANTIWATDWDCRLQILELIQNDSAYVGIRAHHINFVSDKENENESINTFTCWLANISETPHRVTVYLKLQIPSIHQGDYHLQAEVYKEKWATLKERPLPWRIRLDPLRLMLLA